VNFLPSIPSAPALADAVGNLIGTGSLQTGSEPVYSGNRTDYQITYNSVAQTFTVTDERPGSPDGTQTLADVEQLQFANGSSTFNFNTSGALVSETFDNVNATHWVNAFDTVGNQTWAWEISTYDASGNLTTQTGLNHNGTHFLTLYDTGHQYSWTTATINFDANWNETSITGTDASGSHSLTSLEVAAAYDVTLWSATPFDTILNQVSAFSLQYKGFDYVAFYNGAYENSDSLPSLVQTGANSIEATLDYGIDAKTSQVVADPNYTDSLAALGNTIAQAESLGLSVMVRPLIDFLNPAESAPYSVGDWRQDYQPTNVAAFFASYKQMIVSEAEVAQQNGAQMLSIGAELDQLTGSQYLPYWTDIINSMRAVFSGALTYSASWNTASEVSFWSQLNYEGIDCYVPLSNAPNPTLQTLVNGWLQPATEATNPGAFEVIGNQSPIQYFENLSAQSGKPLLFTELGYANDSGAAADPSASGNSPDPTLQSELYQAFFHAWTQSKSTSLIGAYFWEWDPNGSSSNVGPNIDSFSPQNSPAQSAVTAGFEAANTPAAAQPQPANAVTPGSTPNGTGPSVPAHHDSFVFAPNAGPVARANFAPEMDAQFNRAASASVNAGPAVIHSDAVAADSAFDPIQNATKAELHLHQNGFHIL
jgi:hypothetical protein